MTTVSNNMRDKAAQDLRQTMAATSNILQLMEELTSNERMTTAELRHVAETLLDMWESNGIYGALTEYIETLAEVNRADVLASLAQNPEVVHSTIAD